MIVTDEQGRSQVVEESAETTKPDPRPQKLLAHVLPTDRIGFERQISLLRAFAAEFAANGGKPVTCDQAGKVVTPPYGGSTVAQATGFFVDAGLLLRADKGSLIPSQHLVEYNKACQWDEAEAKRHLRACFENAWFATCLVPRLQVSPNTPKSTCLAVLARESGASPEHNQKVENLLNYLVTAGIIAVSGDSVSLILQKPGHAQENQPAASPKPTEPNDDSSAVKHTLYLDSARKRKAELVAPLDLTRAEYKRICSWIEVVHIVPPEGNEQNRQ